jgi:REP element-mobilizing transposase RayT
MPRQPRLDVPGLLQHVMARGIERRKIFWDDKDRSSFLERLAVILEETQTQCYAWALIPNHFHLLLRTSLTPLSKVMRRLMTGYAVTFNKRHKRSGHLFQNRYKSVVCEEDQYLLELIRYIHLNPLRAGLVKDLKELDKYPWTGHSAIMGKKKNPLVPCPSSKNRFTQLNCSEGAPKGIQLGPEKPEKYLAEKTIEDVLLHFGDKLREARRRYRQFVKQGVDQGSRPELQGGGLLRSAGGDKRTLLGRKKEERELYDERILGGGDFVAEALQKAGES